MSNKITIETIDEVSKRIPNATYAEIKEALEICDGEVIDAIIYLEGRKGNTSSKKSKISIDEIFGKDGDKIKSQLKEILRKSSVVRVIIDKNGKIHCTEKRELTFQYDA